MLQFFQCIWLGSDGSLYKDKASHFEPIDAFVEGVQCDNVLQPILAWGELILMHPFLQVLYLDCDSMPVSLPDVFFESPGYVAKGSMFFPDIWREGRNEVSPFDFPGKASRMICWVLVVEVSIRYGNGSTPSRLFDLFICNANAYLQWKTPNLASWVHFQKHIFLTMICPLRKRILQNCIDITYSCRVPKPGAMNC